MISAFGPTAERLAKRLPELEAIVCDPGFMSPAYVAAVERRVAGTPFSLMLLLDDPRASFALSVAHHILVSTADHDERQRAFQSLALGETIVNGQPAREIWPQLLPPDFAGHELFALADAILVRSSVERARLAPFYRRSRPIVRVLAEPTVPRVGARRGRMSVVVWAPHRSGAETALEAFALAEFRGPVTIVCADGRLDTLAGPAFMPPDDPRMRAALETAGVVVCPDVGDPGEAVAFARAGFTVVAPVTSGAAEYIERLTTYDAANIRSLWEAVASAFGRPTGGVRAFAAPPPAPKIPALPASVVEPPLVSVVIPTYNRRADLERVLGTLARQIYPNIEVVVVNDAGEAVDDVVARYPVARVVNQAVNAGVIRTTMAGLRVARGAYIQFLADDDVLYPDHIQRLLGAMLRCDAAAAHGNTLIRYEERGADGAWETTGFNALVFNDSATPTDALLSTPIAGQAMLVRRDVFEQIGAWREDSLLADQEFQFRLWRAFPSVWVDNMTAEWTIREASNFSRTVNSADELARIFNELHPVEGRPLVDADRARALNAVAARPPGYIFPASFLVPR